MFDGMRGQWIGFGAVLARGSTILLKADTQGELSRQVEGLDRQAQKLKVKMTALADKLAMARADQQEYLVTADVGEGELARKSAAIAGLVDQEVALDGARKEVERQIFDAKARLAAMRDERERTDTAERFEAAVSAVSAAANKYVAEGQEFAKVLSSVNHVQATGLSGRIDAMCISTVNVAGDIVREIRQAARDLRQPKQSDLPEPNQEPEVFI